MEENLNFFKIEDDLNLFENGRRPTFFQIRQPKTIKINTIVVAPLRVTLY